ncbi:hypothetical protein [Rugamonas rubra]|uniref:Limonene hydroxylase n=1 Tax=Rugamonas rubra TaxID=758825 RepID=A0A1I4QD37_9BURK|nr:hypothetical protein [Rugamonas rubra]SFM38011.1 hypothetical protein SAMN02982985_03848 [Rugamonas rubra]
MKTWLTKLFGGADSAVPQDAPFPPPWAAERPSIYRFLAAYQLAGDQPLPAEADVLPDEAVLHAGSDTELRWAPGALDGVLGHHSSAASESDAAVLQEALLCAARSPTRHNLQQFYRLIETDKALGQVDALMARLRHIPQLPLAELYALVRWLAMECPDRGPLKIAIALLGLFRPAYERELLMRLGMHDEFTLYALVSLGNTLNGGEVEDAWWSLARRVNGWGRIHLVERLARTERADIRHWLLREGYKNSIMDEYLAYACASGGDLLGSLRADAVDPALLLGAGEIIAALIAGGPAQDIDDYADGAAVLRAYLERLLAMRPTRLEHLSAVEAIISFVEDEERAWDTLAAHGWDRSVRAKVAALAGQVLALDYWPGLVVRQLSDPDAAAFASASRAASAVGIDPWEAYYERQVRGGSDQWYFLMQTDDPLRVRRVIALALSQIDLDAIGGGAALANGFGEEFAPHRVLDSLLQGLGRFPATGYVLIQAGLRSPVIRNRNLAMRALRDWTPANWPSDARADLQRAYETEPNADVRQNLARLLAGQALE